MLKKISPYKIDRSLIDLIEKQWILVTVGTISSFNSLTASWGSIGKL
jgi:hypothetical protein